MATADTDCKSARIELLSPLRVKKWGSFQASAQRIDFPAFIGLLAGRYRRLAENFGLPLLPNDAAFVDLARDAEWLPEDVRLVRRYRVSSRHRRALPLHGLVGNFHVRGPLAPLLPLLRLGEWIQAGSSTTMGNGAYRLDLPHCPTER